MSDDLAWAVDIVEALAVCDPIAPDNRPDVPDRGDYYCVLCGGDWEPQTREGHDPACPWLNAKEYLEAVKR